MTTQNSKSHEKTPKEIMVLKNKSLPRFVGSAIKWGAGTLVCLVLACEAFFVGLNHYLNVAHGPALISKLIADQTGGRAEIGRMVSALPASIRIEDVKVFLPMTGTNAAIESQPSLSLQTLRLKFRPWRLLMLHLDLDEAAIDGLEASLKKTTSGSSLDGLIAFRDKNIAKPTETPLPPPSKPITNIRDIHILQKKILFPIWIKMRDIGLHKMRIHYEEENASKETINFDLLDISLLLELEASWDHIFLQAKIKNEKDHFVTIKKAVRKRHEPIESISSDSVVDSGIEVSDFSHIKLWSKIEPKTAKINRQGSETNTPLPTLDFDLDTWLEKSFEQIRLSQKFHIGAILSEEISGKITLEDGSTRRINTDLSGIAQIDLEAISKLGLLAGSRFSGRFGLKEFRVNGLLDLDSLKNKESLTIPMIVANITADHVRADVPSKNLKLESLNANIGTKITPGPHAGSLQIEDKIQIGFETMRLTSLKDQKVTVVEFKDVNLMQEAAAIWPDQTLSQAKLDLDIGRILAKGPKLGVVDTSAKASLAASGDKNLNELSLTGKFFAKDLVAAEFDLQCKHRCQSSDLKASVLAHRLDKIYTVALPFLAASGKAGSIPALTNGAFDASVKVKATLPDPQENTTKVILEQGKADIAVNLALSKLNFSLPDKGIKIDGFDFRTTITGGLQHQNIDADINLAKITSKPTGTKDQTTLGHWHTAIQLKNDFEDIEQSKDLAQTMNQSIRVTSAIETIHAAGVKAPINQLAFNTNATVHGLNTFKIPSLVFAVPDFGLNVQSSMKADINSSKELENTEIKLLAALNHSGQELSDHALSTRGKLNIDLTLHMPTMSQALIDGSAEFKDFSVTMKDSLGDESKNISIEHTAGKIPIHQKIDLSSKEENKTKIASSEPPKETQKPLSEQNPKESVAGRDISSNPPPDDTNERMETSLNAYLAKEERRAKIPPNNYMSVVDYGATRPLFTSKHPISIKAITAKHLKLENMEFDVELRQNQLVLNQFIIEFLDGKIQGSSQIEFEKKLKNIRLAMQMTRLNTKRLEDSFPQYKARVSSLSFLNSSPYLDATMRLNFDATSADMDGGLEITSIGKEQLKMMLFYVDPEGKDPSIESIRQALAVGEVRQVTIPIKNGQIGLDVDVRVLELPIPIPKFQNFPMTQILKNFMDAGEKSDQKVDLPATEGKEARK